MKEFFGILPSAEFLCYAKFGNHATNMPSNIRFATNGVFNSSMQYRYDCMGNIVEIFENGRTVCRYEYDSLGRLTREDNVDFAKTTTWAYDNNGNIIAKYEYELTAKPTSELHLLDCNYIPYTYDDNSDMLLSYGNETFVYDTIGNPTTYRGKNVMWTAGRRLMIYDGDVYGYDARGRRISKNDVTFTYDSNGNIIKQSNGLEFLYDHTGVFAVQYNGATYYYRKDIQGNIIAILDNTGTVVVKYKYDAWGKCKVLDATGAEITDNTHIGILNPFRYRSYYFDDGIGLYFLKTRYYDPEIGRFMTIDDIAYLDPENINGLNLYAYCLNNPVMYLDGSGHSPDSIWKTLLGVAVGVVLAVVTVAAIVVSGGSLLVPVLIGAGVGAGLNLVGQGVSNLSQGKGFFEDINWGNVALGGLSGAAFATGVGGLWGAVAIGATSNAGMSALEDNSWANIGFSALVGGASAFVGFKLGRFVSNKLLNINTNLGIGDYVNMARVDGARFLSRSIVALMSKLYTMGSTIVTGVGRGVTKFVGNYIGDWF